MFKKRKHRKLLNDYVKPTTSMKVNNIIRQVIPTPPKNSGLSDSEGFNKAYQQANSIFVDGNKMYVAGTRSIGEAFRDWPEVIAYHTDRIGRYAAITEALESNPQVDTLIGHSLGASAVAEVQRQTNNKYMARYYGAPFLNLNPFDGPDPRNQTFRHPGDLFSAFDHKANTLRPTNFNAWWWAHAYDGYDPKSIPESYSNDFDFNKDHPKMEPNI